MKSWCWAKRLLSEQWLKKSVLYLVFSFNEAFRRRRYCYKIRPQQFAQKRLTNNINPAVLKGIAQNTAGFTHFFQKFVLQRSFLSVFTLYIGNNLFVLDEVSMLSSSFIVLLSINSKTITVKTDNKYV